MFKLFQGIHRRQWTKGLVGTGILLLIGVLIAETKILQQTLPLVWLIAQFNPWWIFASLTFIFAPLFLFQKPKRRGILVLMLLGTLVCWQSVTEFSKDKVEDKSLHVLSLNLHLEGEGVFPALLEEHKEIDILLLQEFSPSSEDWLRKNWHKYPNAPCKNLSKSCFFPFYSRRIIGNNYVFRQAILSRYPLRNRKIIPSKGAAAAGIQYAELEISPKIAILNVHLPGWGPWNAYKDGWSSFGRDLAAIEPSMEAQRKDVDQIVSLIERAETSNRTEPVQGIILGGDFNFTVSSHYAARLSKVHMKNSFSRIGKGYPFSYPAGFPLVRIDHIYSKNLSLKSARYYRVGNTDHRGLMTVFQL